MEDKQEEVKWSCVRSKAEVFIVFVTFVKQCMQPSTFIDLWCQVFGELVTGGNENRKETAKFDLM